MSKRALRTLCAMLMCTTAAAVVLADTARSSRPEELETSPLDALLPHIGPTGGNGIDAPPQVAIYDEFAERMRIRNEVVSLFVVRDDRDLAKLEAMLNAFRTSDERTEGGYQKIGLAFECFDNRLATPQQSIKYSLGTVDQWLRQFPNSVSARIVRASLLRNRAVAAVANTFPDHSGEVPGVKRLVDDLVRQLEADREVAATDRHWHMLMMEAKSMARSSVAEILAILDDASRRFPRDVEIYKAAAAAVALVSNDLKRDIEAVGLLAASRGEVEGDANYALLYRGVVYRLGGLHVTPELGIDWARFRKGVADVIQRYPVQWNIQGFAAVSCAGGDSATTRSLLVKVRGRPLRQMWQPLELLEQCRTWANSDKAPNPAEKAIDN